MLGRQDVRRMQRRALRVLGGHSLDHGGSSWVFLVTRSPMSDVGDLALCGFRHLGFLPGFLLSVLAAGGWMEGDKRIREAWDLLERDFRDPAYAIWLRGMCETRVSIEVPRAAEPLCQPWI